MRGVIVPFIILTGAVLGTGWALAGWLDTRDAAYGASIAIAAGIALIILISIVSLEVAWWHPAVTVGVTLAAAGGGQATRVIGYRGRPQVAQIMRDLLNNYAVGLLAVIPLLLVLAGLQLVQAIPGIFMAFPRARVWLTVTSVVLVAVFAFVAIARFALD